MDNAILYPVGSCKGNHYLCQPLFVLGDFLEVLDILGHSPSQVGQILSRVSGVLWWTNRFEGFRAQVALRRCGGPGGIVRLPRFCIRSFLLRRGRKLHHVIIVIGDFPHRFRIPLETLHPIILQYLLVCQQSLVPVEVDEVSRKASGGFLHPLEFFHLPVDKCLPLGAQSTWINPFMAPMKVDAHLMVTRVGFFGWKIGFINPTTIRAFSSSMSSRVHPSRASPAVLMYSWMNSRNSGVET